MKNSSRGKHAKSNSYAQQNQQSSQRRKSNHQAGTQSQQNDRQKSSGGHKTNQNGHYQTQDNRQKYANNEALQQEHLKINKMATMNQNPVSEINNVNYPHNSMNVSGYHDS